MADESIIREARRATVLVSIFSTSLPVPPLFSLPSRQSNFSRIRHTIILQISPHPRSSGAFLFNVVNQCEILRISLLAHLETRECSQWFVLQKLAKHERDSHSSLYVHRSFYMGVGGGYR